MSTSINKHFTFFMSLIVRMPELFKERREFVQQFLDIGIRSLSTTIVAGLFTGAVLALQFYLQLKDFGGESILGGLNTSGTLREVGPLLIAFMLAGKVGAYTSAELSTMKASDQMLAIRCLGIDPISYLVLPRFWAVAINSVLLLIFGLFISVLGGTLAVWISADIHPDQYFLMISRFANWPSVFLALSKSICFGFLIGYICCANGYWAENSAEGVGKAVQNTAVQSMLAIVVADFLVTHIINIILNIGIWL